MAKKQESSADRFKPVSSDKNLRLTYRSWGWDKVGKNHFGYTMPDPIFGLYLDPAGAEGVADKFVRGEVEGFGKKDIRQIQYRFNKKFHDQDLAIEVRDQFIEDYQYALKNARSIQLDETELWELCRFAEFGKESDLQREYGPLNGMYRGLIQDAYDAGVNLQLIQKVKEQWKNGKTTGEMEPMGFKQAGNIVQVSLEHSWSDEEGFQVKIKNCRQNTAIWGYSAENLTFPQLGVLVYDDTSEEDWQ